MAGSTSQIATKIIPLLIIVVVYGVLVWGISFISNPQDTIWKRVLVYGEVLAFSKGHVPVLKEHVQWQNGEDIILNDFPNPLEIDLAVWIVTTDMDEGMDYNFRAGVSQSDCKTATRIWSKEAHGLTVKCLNPQDRTNDTGKVKKDNGTEETANIYFTDNAFNCERDAERIKTVGHKPKVLNIYYVDYVDIGAPDRPSRSRGVWCDKVPDVIAIGLDGHKTILAHELGHAFLLDHIDHLESQFDNTNVMHGKSSQRQYLTEGQVFRAFFNEHSAMNSKDLYDIGPGRGLNPKRFCGTDVNKNDPICPSIDKRLWADGTWLPK